MGPVDSQQTESTETPSEKPPIDESTTVNSIPSKTSVSSNQESAGFCSDCVLKCYLFTANTRLAILNAIEANFYKLGCFAGRKPYVFIISGLLLTFLSFGMLLRKESEKRQEWIPKSELSFSTDTFWIRRWNQLQEYRADNLQSDEVRIIVIDDELLSPQSLLKMYQLHEMVLDLNSTNMHLREYCRWGLCRAESLLRFWNYSEPLIKKQTRDQILEAVNDYDRKHNDLDHFLTNIKRNDSGYITGAKVTKMKWKFPYSDYAWKWQIEFSNTFKTNPTDFKELYAYCFYDFTQYGTGFEEDALLVFIGYSIMGVYIIICLGKCNLVEQKLGLAFVGIMCVAIGYFVTLGLGGIFNITYGALNRVLALLLLGIGIDDMFVILGALNNLSKLEKERPVPEQIGLIMKHAGVSITITTLSDITAFAIGATSAFPGLRTFCLYNCIGILSIYIMQITFFASCMSLDLRRVLDHRDGLFCCYKHTDYTPNKWSEKEILKIVFYKAAKNYLSKKPVKIFVIILTFLILAVCAWNVSKLETDTSWQRVMYATNTPYYRYFVIDEKYFSTNKVDVYCTYLTYSVDQSDYQKMAYDLSQSPYVLKDYTANWLTAFLHWCQERNFNVSVSEANPNYFDVSLDDFDLMLERFWLSKEGTPYRIYIDHQVHYSCLLEVPKHILCSENFCQSPFFKSDEEISGCKVRMKAETFVPNCNCTSSITLDCLCETPGCLDEDPQNTRMLFTMTCTIDRRRCRINTTNIPFSNMNCFNKVIYYPVTKLSMRIKEMSKNSQRMDIMKELEGRVAKYFNQTNCLVFSKHYLEWRINSVLEWEIKRNLSLAFLSVFVITFMMIMNWKTSLLVVTGVIFTLVDISGSLNLWGLYIDTTSCVIVTISVGLVVDYSVHIGFTYMTMKGKNNDRMIITMKEIGPPVFHGGFSTFIAVMPLSMGSTYPFRTFFKIFLLVVMFGLFHGIVFLPVLLSIFAPPSYPSAKNVKVRKFSKIKSVFSSRKSGINNVGLDLHNETNTQDTIRDVYKTDYNTPYHISSNELDGTGLSPTFPPLEKNFDSTQNGTKPNKNGKSE
ncbi:protein patched homolog 1 isoform X1 [Octopus vulgaris]|uniref:Protein patched homolog 1 isoform X1 n=1 Tax=Octopus vulgaris TaxID=6645 RepID=A0AA36BTH9_OCTVU|nr:protein patched homolog 1 isoform X1 [Octopus vulgaris]